jgi:hypothetical protein
MRLFAPDRRQCRWKFLSVVVNFRLPLGTDWIAAVLRYHSTVTIYTAGRAHRARRRIDMRASSGAAGLPAGLLKCATAEGADW